MTGDNSATHNNPPHKVFCVSNIKSHIPLILDLEWANYDAWRHLFMNHCESYDAIKHIDETYDHPQQTTY